jgi:hypothetical protein
MSALLPGARPRMSASYESAYLRADTPRRAMMWIESDAGRETLHAGVTRRAR